MQLQLNTDESINLIHSYQNAQIRIDEERYTSGVIVTPEQLHSLDLNTVYELKAEHFEMLLPYRPEMVILGTGPTQIFPEFSLSKCLISNQIGLEVMNSSAACRTYNVLAGDGRKVLGLLLP